MCVLCAEEAAEEEEEKEEAAGYRIKNKNPTQRCGQKSAISSYLQKPS